ncbi:site-specific integrase [Pseudomonas sp.]|uniref:site-specific integrase n=1 Tax=Pseudomonas sp. TaxID=306 RepID=UPI003266394E
MAQITRSSNSSKSYDSKAARLLIPEFRLLDVRFSDNFESPAAPKHDFYQSHKGYYPNFPVIIQGDGTPWEIGNLYLVHRLLSSLNYESRSFRGKADHLLDYLRFLEDEDLDFLYFPENDLLKVTYRYRRRLADQIIAGELKRGTGSARINAVVGFYKTLMRNGLVSESDFKHEPFEIVKKYVSIESNFGLSKLLHVESHNLAISAPKQQSAPGYINDGGLLRPLSVEEQEKVLVALLSSSREYQLIFYLALFTGARIQTVCTIRVRHIWQALDGDGDLRMPIGAGTGVDTKFGRPMTLKIPGWLVQDLRIYSRSMESSKRRDKSFYGNVDDNYLFLANTGSEYYTSKREILDRGRTAQGEQSDDRAYGSIREGATIRQYVTETILPRIRAEDSEFLKFRFHDLRATFGMNLLEDELEHRGEGGTMAALEHVQQRMGHRDKRVTLQYLNYKTDMTRKANIMSRYEARLFKHVNTTVSFDFGSNEQ